MNAYFFEKSSREVGIIINDVERVALNEVKGINDTMVILNPDEEITDYIVTNKEFVIGDKISIYERNYASEYRVETPEERIKRLEETILNLRK